MQAHMDSGSLKHVIKALTCLAKYGEDVVLYTTSDSLTVSSTNSSASAYCRFKYSRPFFSRFQTAVQAGNVFGPQGQVNTKSLLAILKHRTVEKTVEKCELAIVEGGEHKHDVSDEERDSLESKLIVRLHCKHGVVKTHRLLLHTTELSSPAMLDSEDESRLVVAPKALRDVIEHFPFPKGPKADPKLIWKFDEEDVFLRGQEASFESEAKGLSTELSLSASEFEYYDVLEPPITICFHIKEFQATLLLAEQLGLNLIIRFLDPFSPIYMEIEGDLAETLFVISTSQVFDPSNSSAAQPVHPKTRVVDLPRAQQRPNRRKRPLEHEQNNDTYYDDDDSLYGIRDGDGDRQPRPESRASSISEYGPRKRPMKAAVRTDRESLARELDASESGPSNARAGGSMPPPSFMPVASYHPQPTSPRGSVFPSQRHDDALSPRQREQEPLFLPSTQLSQVAEAAIRESGLGIEDMDADEFTAMMEGEGVEVETKGVEQRHAGANVDMNDRMSEQEQETGQEEVNELARDDEEDDTMDMGAQAQRSDSFDLYYDGTQLEPTQGSNGSKNFKPLFDD